MHWIILKTVVVVSYSLVGTSQQFESAAVHIEMWIMRCLSQGSFLPHLESSQLPVLHHSQELTIAQFAIACRVSNGWKIIQLCDIGTSTK